MWSNSVARLTTTTCAIFSLCFFFFGFPGYQHITSWAFKDVKSGMPIVAFAIPTLLSGSLCLLLVVRPFFVSPPKSKALPHQLPRYVLKLIRFFRSGHGDPKFDRLAFAFILVPSIVLFLGNNYRKLHGKNRDASENITTISKTFAIVSLLQLSFFLIPVTRHSPILSAFNWGKAHAVRLHIWAGRIGLTAALLHGGMFMYKWVVLSGENMWSMLFPPSECLVSANHSKQQTCNSEQTDCNCYDLVRNLCGLLAVTGMIVIGLTSFNYVRRKYYRIFYLVHVVAAPLTFLAVILHWNKSILYLSPSLLYYIAGSFPSMLETWRKIRFAGGSQIHSVEQLASSSGGRDCVALTFQASIVAVERFCPVQHVYLTAPSSSSVHHPFTVNSVPGEANQLRIIFRVDGCFTANLASHLLSSDSGSEMPVIQLEGYHGGRNRVNEVLSHDVSLIIAGGIGITPYLSMVHSLHSILANSSSDEVRRIELHWMCRDHKLVEYVKKKYIEPLLAQSHAQRFFQIRIVVHQTGEFDDPAALTDSQQSANGRKQKKNVMGHGQPFTDSRFSTGARKLMRSNIVPFLSFSCAGWIGLWTIWLLYSNVQEKHVVLTRIWAALTIVGVGVVGAIGSNILIELVADDRDQHYSLILNIRARSPLMNSSMDDGDTEENIIGTSLEMVVLGTAGDSHEPLGSLNSETDGEISLSQSVAFVHVKGRPTVNEIFSTLDEAMNPGVFSCGPPGLLADVRWAARARCNWPAGGVPIYEEKFEM